MLTDPDDMVLDPFAGSCVTGAVAEQLGRRWACCELDAEYLKGAQARFHSTTEPSNHSKAMTYSLNAPCGVPVNENEVPLIQNGGAARPEVSARR